MPKITVTRPFTFSAPPVHNPDGTIAHQAQSHEFTPGEYDVHESVANHPWIQGGADGAISSPKPRQPEARVSRAQPQVLARRVGEDDEGRPLGEGVPRTSAENPGGIDDEGKIANRTANDTQGRQPPNQDGSVSPSGIVKDVKGSPPVSDKGGSKPSGR